MSAAEDKNLGRPTPALHTRARCTLKQLKQRWGHLERYQGATQDRLVLIAMGGHRETWRRVTRGGDESIWEMEEAC